MTEREDSPWADVAAALCETLGDGLEVAGVVESADLFRRVGAACLEIIVEATDLVGPEQVVAYTALCDLIETRLAGEADDVVGFMLHAEPVDPGAFAEALRHMRRTARAVRLIVPLDAEQARDLADSGTGFGDLVDDAGALILRAVERGTFSAAAAAAILDELDELIGRECARRIDR